MFMREQDRIEFKEIQPKYLLAKIGAGVNHKTASIHSNMNRRAEPFVPKVDGSTHIAQAPNQRYSRRRSRTQQCDKHKEEGEEGV